MKAQRIKITFTTSSTNLTIDYVCPLALRSHCKNVIGGNTRGRANRKADSGSFGSRAQDNWMWTKKDPGEAAGRTAGGTTRDPPWHLRVVQGPEGSLRQVLGLPGETLPLRFWVTQHHLGARGRSSLQPTQLGPSVDPIPVAAGPQGASLWPPHLHYRCQDLP